MIPSLTGCLDRIKAPLLPRSKYEPEYAQKKSREERLSAVFTRFNLVEIHRYTKRYYGTHVYVRPWRVLSHL